MTATHSTQVRSCAEMLSRHAVQGPDRLALVFLERGEREAGSFTYAELERRARTIARAMLRRGLAGQRVVLAYPTCLEFVAALYGCFYSGAVAVPAPIDGYGRSSSRLQAIMHDADAAAVFSLTSAMGAPGEPEPGPAAAAKSAIPWLATDALPPVPDDAPLPDIDPEALALLQYTSGSTGRPRGVMLTHRNIVHNQRALTEVLATGAADVVVNWLPLYHDMGLIGGVLHTSYVGGLGILIPPLAFVQKPRRWLESISRYRATVSMAPSFAYALTTQSCGADHRIAVDLASWRVAICGGEPIRPQVLDQFTAAFESRGFDARAWMPAYGLAEGTLIASAAAAGTGVLEGSTQSAASVAPAGEPRWARSLTCCGPPVSGLRMAIVDADSQRPVPLGQPGEIWLQGPSVAAGYWNQPEETRATFGARLAGDARGDWLRTGDLGFISPAGLVVTGRAKEIILIRGVNFDPVDIETAALECDAAFDAAAAFSLDHEDGGQLVLVQEIRRNAIENLDRESLAAKVVDSIYRHFGLRLHDLVLLRPRTLPRTTSGKIQRHASKDHYLSGKLAALGAIQHPGLGRWRARVPA